MRRWDDGEGEVAFDGVDKVDEAVEDEAIEDEGVEETDDGALFEGAGLEEGCGEGVGKAAREMVEAGFGVGSASADAEVEAIEAFKAQCESDEGEEEEGGLVGEWKHGFVREHTPRAEAPFLRIRDPRLKPRDA